MPFIALQLIALFIVGNSPPLVNYLPTRISLTSETAPPPVNPRLQYCMEEYVAAQFVEDGDALRTAIAQARGLPLEMIPDDLRDDLIGGFDKADDAFAKMDAIADANDAVSAAAVAYRPLHVTVRALERDAAKLTARISGDQTQLSRLRSTAPDSPRIAQLEADVADLTAERDQLLSGVPAEWDEVHTTFAKLTKAEVAARRAYRRTVDDAFEPVNDLVAVLGATERLASMQPDLVSLRDEVGSADPAAMVERIAALRSAMRDAEAGKAVVDGLADARKALRRDPDPVTAAQALDQAIVALEQDLAWRRQATVGVLPGLQSYAAALGDTIGLRQQPALPAEQALYVAACNSEHRDISLNF